MIPYFIILVFYVVFTIETSKPLTNSDSHRELALELGLGLELNRTGRG